jgi:hypothetical protein
MPYTNTDVATLTGGLKQSLLNIMTVINEVATPLVSNLKTSQAIQPVHQWTSFRNQIPTSVNAVSAPRGGLVLPAGISSNASTMTGTVPSTNNTQIISTSFALTNTAIASHYAGVADLINFFKTQTLKYVSNGLELSICQGVLGTGDGTTTGVGPQMQGLIGWAAAAAGYSGYTQAAAKATFDTSVGEDSLKQMLQAQWSKGIHSDFMYMSPLNKGKVDKWTSNVVKNLYLENKEQGGITLPAFISVYQSSFGVLRLYFGTAMPDTNVVCGVMDELAIAYLTDRLPKVIPLGVQYDGFGFLTVLEATLEDRDPVSVCGLVLS